MTETVQSGQGRAVLEGHLLRCERRAEGNPGSENGLFMDLPAGGHGKGMSTRPSNKDGGKAQTCRVGGEGVTRAVALLQGSRVTVWLGSHHSTLRLG